MKEGGYYRVKAPLKLDLTPPRLEFPAVFFFALSANQSISHPEKRLKDAVYSPVTASGEAELFSHKLPQIGQEAALDRREAFLSGRSEP